MCIDSKFLGLLHDSKDSAATSKGGIQERKKNIEYYEKIGGREELNLTAGKCALLAAGDRRPPRNFFVENILRQFVSMLVCSTIYI